MTHGARGSARWSTTLLAIAFAVLSSSCTASKSPTTPARSAKPSVSSRPGANPSSGRSAPGSTVGQTGGGSTNSYNDDGGVGEMARVLLRASPARRLVIEIAYVPGRKPSQQALDHLVTVLHREARKPDGIVTASGAQLPDSK